MKITILILFLAFISPRHNASAQPAVKIPVRVLVHGSSENVRNTVQSALSTHLRSKSNVTTTDIDPLYIIVANIADIKPGDNTPVGVSLSVVMNKKIQVGDGVKYEFVTSAVYSLSLTEISKKCEQLVATFDVQYFDSERNGTSH